MMQTLELPKLAKGTSWDGGMLINKEIKAIAIAIIDLHLLEGISKSVSRSIGKSIHRNFC